MRGTGARQRSGCVAESAVSAVGRRARHAVGGPNLSALRCARGGQGMRCATSPAQRAREGRTRGRGGGRACGAATQVPTPGRTVQVSRAKNTVHVSGSKSQTPNLRLLQSLRFGPNLRLSKSLKFESEKV